jgi:hypothetical protein
VHVKSQSRVRTNMAASPRAGKMDKNRARTDAQKMRRGGSNTLSAGATSAMLDTCRTCGFKMFVRGALVAGVSECNAAAGLVHAVPSTLDLSTGHRHAYSERSIGPRRPRLAGSLDS